MRNPQTTNYNWDTNPQFFTKVVAKMGDTGYTMATLPSLEVDLNGYVYIPLMAGQPRSKHTGPMVVPTAGHLRNVMSSFMCSALSALGLGAEAFSFYQTCTTTDCTTTDNVCMAKGPGQVMSVPAAGITDGSITGGQFSVWTSGSTPVGSVSAVRVSASGTTAVPAMDAVLDSYTRFNLFAFGHFFAKESALTDATKWHGRAKIVAAGEDCVGPMPPHVRNIQAAPITNCEGEPLYVIVSTKPSAAGALDAAYSHQQFLRFDNLGLLNAASDMSYDFCFVESVVEG